MTELRTQTPPRDIIRGVRPAQRAVNATLQSDGVNLVLDAVSEEEETDLLALVDAGRWDCSLSRRVQHYGHRFAYSTKTCVPVAEPPPPRLFASLSGSGPCAGARTAAATVTSNAR